VIDWLYNLLQAWKLNVYLGQTIIFFGVLLLIVALFSALGP
jgi:hypothetical protein